MRFILYLIHVLGIYSIKIITNKIIDVKSININKYKIYDSIFFISFDEFIVKKNKIKNYAINNNFIYIYKTEKHSPSIIDFLMVKYLHSTEMPIFTSMNKYFKPFQYTIYDILIYQYFGDKLIFKDKIKKNDNYYIIDNAHNGINRV